jgi:hypothetical protein
MPVKHLFNGLLAGLDVDITIACMKVEAACRSDFEKLYPDIRRFAYHWMDEIATAMKASGYQLRSPVPEQIVTKRI